MREVILTTLTRLGDDVAVDGLVLCLRSEDAALRNEAIQAMKELPDEVAQLMSGILADPDPDVRIFAVNVLESLRHPQVEAWLIGVIERDPHVNVCATGGGPAGRSRHARGARGAATRSRPLRRRALHPASPPIWR